MFKWLRSFFYSDDPDVRLAGGLSEHDARQYQELLANNGIGSMAKSMSAFSGRFGGATTWANDHALWVKKSDVAPAIEVLGHLITRYLTDEAREVLASPSPGQFL